MKNNIIDYHKNLEDKIASLRNNLGDNNAREDLRRFAHHLRNYEYSGHYNSVASKLLLKAEIIKSIYELCSDNNDQGNIKKLLHHTFELNLKIHDTKLSRIDAIGYLSNEISELNIDNKFSIIIIQAKENYFSIIIEKLFEGISSESLRFISNLLIDCSRESLHKQEIYKKLNSSLKYIKNCPIKLHCLDKNTNKNKFTKVIDLNKSANIRIFNYFSGNLAVGYSHLYETPKQIANFYSLNIVYAVSYILAKKSLSIDINEKRMIHIDKKEQTNKHFQNNVRAIIEYTISRLADNDKYVIGALDRKFSLNHRVKHQPTEIKQVNINELDEVGLRNLKKLVSKRIHKVSRLKKHTKNLKNHNYDIFVNKNDKFIPQLVLDQSKLIRAKSFFDKAQILDNKGLKLQSIVLYTTALKLDSKFKEAYFARGLNYYNLENFQQAINDFTKALEIDASYNEAYHHRGLSYARMKELEKAISDFNITIKLDKKA